MSRIEDIEKPALAGNLPMAWASDVMAEMLRRLDLKFLALNPGASYRGLHDSLVNYLGNRDPQMLLCLNEDHAVAIAHGYAKVTEQPMGVVLHSNVGLMHGLMQVFNAWCARVPMVIVGATGPVDAELRRPWVDWVHTAKDQGALLRHFTKWDDQPASVGATVEALLRANQIARTAPRGPVYVCLDAGLQETPVERSIALPDVGRYQPGPSPHPSPATLRTLADRLLAAERPIVLAGRVSRRREDWDRRVRLAEALGARVLTDLRTGASFPTDHPLHGAPPRSHYPPAAQELIRRADVILALDSIDLAGAFKLLRVQGGPAAHVVHCSPDPYVHNGWSMDHQGLSPVDLRVLAEPDAAIEGLLPLVEAGMRGRPKKWSGFPTNPLAAARAPAPDLEDGGRPVTQPDVAFCLDQVRRAGGRRFTLVRVGLGWASDHYHFRDPLDFLGYDGGGGLGAGPGMAIGAGLALRGSNRIPLTIIGDGDFLQGATALWTAAHYRIPGLIIVANNRSNFNDEIHQAVIARDRNRPVENKWIGMRMGEPAVDIAGLARAQGLDAAGPIARVGDLLGAIEGAIQAVEEGRPYLLDVLIEPGYAAPLLTRATGESHDGR
ncbi:MAG: thiamine pyrophosphate-binding protein [Proteobacteria bacterium]|nr:thiamine pyrophosphate-binding protein [Pseudomonadota bacterium]